MKHDRTPKLISITWQEDHSISVFSSEGHLYVIDGSRQMSKFLQKGDEEIERSKNHNEYIPYYVLTISWKSTQCSPGTH